MFIFDINFESSFEYDLMFLNLLLFLKKLLINEFIILFLFLELKIFDNVFFVFFLFMFFGEDKSFFRVKFLRNFLFILFIEVLLIVLLLGILLFEY